MFKVIASLLQALSSIVSVFKFLKLAYWIPVRGATTLPAWHPGTYDGVVSNRGEQEDRMKLKKEMDCVPFTNLS